MEMLHRDNQNLNPQNPGNQVPRCKLEFGLNQNLDSSFGPREAEKSEYLACVTFGGAAI